MVENTQILVADDDAHIRRLISHSLEQAGYDVVQASDGREAQRLSAENIPVALFDLKMPHASGIECLEFVREKFPRMQVIILSAVGGIPDVVQAMQLGAYWYLQKPFDPDQLLTLVGRAIELTSLKRENKELRAAISASGPQGQFVGSSDSMQKILDVSAKVAILDTPVMITGESGTGKTTLARMIHQSGPRSAMPFVSLSCAALPRDLLESELFGHERGAFTGAVSSRPGSIEMAQGGTLFLDEIGDMPLELQPKLLTFLQDKMVRRVGGKVSKEVDVRIISATHQDLETMCAEKCFRQDLFFRLNVLPIKMPALRERRDDIQVLAESCLERIASKRKSHKWELSNDALQILRKHSWPGNIRELENLLERATAFSDGSELTSADLHFSSFSAVASSDGTLAGISLEELERRAILDTLRQCGGSKAEAAKLLGVSEKTVYNKLQKLGVSG
jgi:DNA-binding NtrC family response regulator